MFTCRGGNPVKIVFVSLVKKDLFFFGKYKLMKSNFFSLWVDHFKKGFGAYASKQAGTQVITLRKQNDEIYHAYHFLFSDWLNLKGIYLLIYFITFALPCQFGTTINEKNLLAGTNSCRLEWILFKRGLVKGESKQIFTKSISLFKSVSEIYIYPFLLSRYYCSSVLNRVSPRCQIQVMNTSTKFLSYRENWGLQGVHNVS